MTQVLAPQEQKEETKQEVFNIETLISKEKLELIRQNLDIISMLIRAFEGKDVNPEHDVITRLINVKNILERSNFPTMPLINFQVYCRLVAKYHPELECFKDWADLQAEALKSYKALSSEQYVEMMKALQGVAPQPQSSTNINFPGQQAQQQKRGLFRRGPKPEKAEFENE